MRAKFWLGNLGITGDNIKVNFKVIGFRGVDRSHLAQDRDSWRAR